MKKIVPVIVLIITLVASWMYWNSDKKLEEALMSKEWHSTTIAYMNLWDQKISSLDKAVIRSTVKYLPNKNYIKNSTLIFSSKNVQDPIEITISESGQWDVSDSYLIVDATSFKDISTKPVTLISPEQVDELKKLFKISSQQSRKIDVIDERTLLLTSLGHGSNIFVSQ
ncbi:regulatory protein ToxS [Vibrio rumoiensis]|uniref:Regulatory protein ToxS n=1 Tax=Vibrio rumoiensis TaxID=76258 RepID=A0ABW7IT22_9VIBR|nr:regulatory protein ToxS [Vibrio rumoiensis]